MIHSSKEKPNSASSDSLSWGDDCDIPASRSHTRSGSYPCKQIWHPSNIPKLSTEFISSMCSFSRTQVSLLIQHGSEDNCLFHVLVLCVFILVIYYMNICLPGKQGHHANCFMLPLRKSLEAHLLLHCYRICKEGWALPLKRDFSHLLLLSLNLSSISCFCYRKLVNFCRDNWLGSW